MKTRTMSRAEMKRAAMEPIGDDFGLIPEGMVEWCLCQGGGCCCASMLMSEAYRPSGHDGDGKDD
jgi:hypothetical protein